MPRLSVRILLKMSALAVLLARPANTLAGPGLFNTDYPNAGWYLFKGPILQPRFGVQPTYALTQLEYQHVGVGYGGFAGFYPTMGWGYGPYPNWGYGTPYQGIPIGPRPPAPPPPELPPAPPLSLPNQAQFSITVPADAEVWLEGLGTQQTGTVRRFVSPPLEPGASYGYKIHARWREGSRVVEQGKEIVIHAGDEVSVSFPLQ